MCISVGQVAVDNDNEFAYHTVIGLGCISLVFIDPISKHTIDNHTFLASLVVDFLLKELYSPLVN